MVYVSGRDHGQLSLDPLQLHLRLPQQLLHMNSGRVIPHYHLQKNPHNQITHALQTSHCPRTSVKAYAS